MTFEQRLAERAREIDAALVLALEAAGRGGEAVPDRLAAAMRHAVMAGGKRLRPFLLLETAGLLGVEPARAMPAAVALELVHCYSLVHDDLPAMDNDELRRGKPTVWKAFDDWTAILAGDALLALAFEHLASAGDLDPAVRVRLLTLLAEASGPAGMVGGQCLDLEADKLSRSLAADRQGIERMQALKTGALFRFACRAGSVIGRANPEVAASLDRFGAALGAAFQLADDLLDAEGDAAVVGKATAKDAAAGKATLVALLGLDAARARLAEIGANGAASLDGFGPRADGLRAAITFATTRRS